ncbi:NlpC/P60 family protein [Streptomyces sp. G-5]|uniref:C40 family peptidase n=1 Tax=Streptomyces sp. G-5 TaxID=2977231 RepID=UPI0021D05099|nr:C40 family peptidase [Streptomyces sp. G-5]MCU4747248.1 NlpC/P60 family protein [Streptomyces sp. G-5]
MAQHRKPGSPSYPWRRSPVTATTPAAGAGTGTPAGHRRPRSGGAVRTTATLTLAGAASAAVAGGGTALADPAAQGPGTAEVREQVDALHHEAEQATERHHAANEAAELAERDLERISRAADSSTDRLNGYRRALGSHAAAQYRAGGLPPEVQLALSSDPDEYLARAATMDRSGDRQADALSGARQQLLDLERLRAEAADVRDELTGAREEAEAERDTVEAKLAEAEELLATLTEREQRELLARESHGTGTPGAGTDARTTAAPAGATPAPAPAGGPRAQAATAYALAQLGKPYGWGATGPDAYDCSGLTQAAWSAAGVSLPRTSQSQSGAGTKVSRDQLAPGDLVFYYSGLTHVGMYIGNGQIVHASRPGTPVRTAPVDSMPFVTATRPA